MAKKSKKDTTEKNKLIVAIFLTVVILAGIILLSTTLFSNNTDDEPTTSNDSIDRDSIIQKLAESSEFGLRPDEVVNQTIKLSDLPVYPISWQQKFFTPIERSNDLVSGPAADYDNDGLSNKEEYFQGSDPTNPDTLCDGQTDDDQCQGRNDGENVEAGISPLTGLAIDTPKEFVIKRQDVYILDNIQDTFETAAREGVDFPTLYILAKTIDLSDQVEAIPVIEQEDTTDTVLNYIRVRIDLLDGFSQEDELSSFAEIYSLNTIEQLDEAKEKYINFREQMQNSPVPASYVPSHKSYILLFDKLAELIELRKEAFTNETLLDDSFREVNKEKAVEVVWTFRNINEEEDKIELVEPEN